MKVFVIPDIHLKPWIFDRAEEVSKGRGVDRFVCLMDIPDDFGKEFDLSLYESTFDRAIAFQKDHPDMLWAYGNHDICYLWNQRETGFSMLASPLVCRKLGKLRNTLPDDSQLSFIHRIDHVLFLHGGLTAAFAKKVAGEDAEDVDKLIDKINQASPSLLWKEDSVLWCRPQWEYGELYQSDTFVQVVGHTPVKTIYREGPVISCDVFSTHRDGTPIGTQDFLLLDTETQEFETLK
ncbi:MAG: metallophosphoesterase [Clostridia bacterium]|nr:metallophosphoesterase [Clostridia bacterium]